MAYSGHIHSWIKYRYLIYFYVCRCVCVCVCTFVLNNIEGAHTGTLNKWWIKFKTMCASANRHLYLLQVIGGGVMCEYSRMYVRRVSRNPNNYKSENANNSAGNKWFDLSSMANAKSQIDLQIYAIKKYGTSAQFINSAYMWIQC